MPRQIRRSGPRAGGLDAAVGCIALVARVGRNASRCPVAEENLRQFSFLAYNPLFPANENIKVKLISGASIKENVRGIAPARIAAACIGPDWNSYIDAGTLKEVVVSPVAGTDPDVLAELAALLGWGNVHFLDSLRARIFLAQRAAVASFNMDAGDDNQDEPGFITHLPDAIAQVSGLYEAYKAQAISAYPTEQLKQERLAGLRAQASVFRT